MKLNIHGKALASVLFLPVLLTACGLWPAALGAQTLAEGATSYNEVPQEIVIKSESEDKIRTTKPPLKIQTDDLDSIKESLQPDKDLFLYGEFASISQDYPENLFSARIIQPWRAGFSDKTVIAFYPLRKFSEAFNRSSFDSNAKDIQWTLSVTDEEGKIFHKYAGSGLPPESIFWTGENDQREWLKAGHNYAPVYVFVDEMGALKTIVGDIIKFTAIVFQKDSNLNIGLDSVAVFGPTKSMKTVDKVLGEALLTATCDLIKRRYYNVPVKVNVYAQTKDLAEQQADQVSNFLRKELMSGSNLVSYEGFDESFSQQRIDVILMNK